MKKIRKITNNPIFIFSLLFNFIFVSCNRDEIIKSSIEESSNLGIANRLPAKYSDTDVFKGIMFLEGPVAIKLQDFQELNFRNYTESDAEVNEIISFQNLIISNIKASNPTYFSEFRKKIGSGDYYTVKEALNQAAILVKNATLQITKFDENQLKSLQNELEASVSNRNFNKKYLRMIFPL